MTVPFFNTFRNASSKKEIALAVMHLIVLLLSALLVVMITYDTLHNISFLASRTYMRVQFWVCLVFILDILAEWIVSPRKLRFLWRHLLFIIIAIPYLNIVEYFHIDLSPEALYLLRFVPMIRAAYVIAVVTGVMSSNWVSSLFTAYIVIMLATVYFGSLMFFLEEHYINPQVTNYWSAFYWATMDLTTCGSNIDAITPTGKVIAVLLSGEGLILFPVFTVYITNALAGNSSSQKSTDSESGSSGSSSDTTPAPASTTATTATTATTSD